MDVKEYIPVTFESGSVFKVAANEATLTLTNSKKYTDDKTTSIDNKYSQLKATTDSINSTVSKQTTIINNLSDSISKTSTPRRNLITGSYVRKVFKIYGWGDDAKTVNVVKGKTYTFSVNGYCTQELLDSGRRLMCCIYDTSWSKVNVPINITSTTPVTESATFTSNYTGEVHIQGYCYKDNMTSDEAQNNTTFAVVNWIQLEEGETATPWTLAEGEPDINPSLIPTDLNDLGKPDSVSVTTDGCTLLDGSTYDCIHADNATKDDSIHILNISNLLLQNCINYTLSFYAKGSGQITSYLYPNACQGWIKPDGTLGKDVTSGQSSTGGASPITLTATWTKYVITWTTFPQSGNIKNLLIAAESKTDAYIACVKLEKGGRATAFQRYSDKVITSSISNIKQTSDSIVSTVTQIKSTQKGNNEFTGVAGIGWKGGTYNNTYGWEIPYNDYVYLPPIVDGTGDYILSFGNYNSNLQIEIYSTTESYEINRLNYYCNFDGDTELPIILIEEGNNNDTLANTYLISSPNKDLSQLQKDDVVVVQKYLTASKTYVYEKCKISTITSDTSNTYTPTNTVHKWLYKATFAQYETDDDNYKQYASYAKLTTVFNGNTSNAVTDGTAISTLNKDSTIKGNNNIWVRFKEPSSSTKTFLIRIKATSNDTDTKYIGYVQIEDVTTMGTDIRPHSFSGESATLSSSISQTATEIRQQVGDSFTSLTNGNFIINSNTKIIGSLNVTGTDNGITVSNTDGSQITKIQPVSIGTWSNVKNASTISKPLYKTSSVNLLTDSYGKVISASTLDNNFTITEYFDIGTFDKGDNIQMDTNYSQRILSNGNSKQQFSCQYDLYKVVDGNVTSIMSWSNVATKNYLLTETALLRVRVTTTINTNTLETFTPNSYVALNIQVGLNVTVPDKGQLITTVGYDGIAASFGNGNYMMIGKDIAAFKYGEYDIEISKDGIVGLNVNKVYRLEPNASSMTYDNTLGAWCYNCGTNTIYNTFLGLNQKTTTYLYLPSNPYDGQEITVIDKCFGHNLYVVPKGGYNICLDGTTSSSWHSDKYELPQNTMWHFIFSYDCWYAE